MAWTVTIARRVQRQVARLPRAVRDRLIALIADIEAYGPVRGNWPNYSKLGADRHHCHLKKGRPTYVSVWDVTETEARLVEIVYVGTHENAPY